MRRYGEYEQENKALRKRKRKQAMQRKIIGFCLFTFLLGVLCGRIVFAKDVEEEPAQSLAENTESIENLKQALPIICDESAYTEVSCKYTNI